MKLFFFNDSFLKVFIEFVTILLLFYVLVRRHVGSSFPDQGLNLHLLHGRRSLNHWATTEVSFMTLS